MKIFNLLCLYCFLLLTACSSRNIDLEGSWICEITIPGRQDKLPVIFNIEKKDSSYSVVMHDPDNMSLNNKATISVGDSIKIGIQKFDLAYNGVIKDHKTIEGFYSQMGIVEKVPLIKQKEIIKFDRPQTPSQESMNDYVQRTIYVDNTRAKLVDLKGEFCRPKGGEKFPVAILIAGSGPLDMDETMADHKPFLVISDYLVRNGIAVVRYNKRGVNGSVGDYANATTEDFASDVEAIIDYLKTREDVNPEKIGLIGHSEGGIIAFMLGAKRKDIKYIVSMAGTGISGRELFRTQTQDISAMADLPDSVAELQKMIVEKAEFIANTVPTDTIKKNLRHYLSIILPEKEHNNKIAEVTAIQSLMTYSSPWMKYISNYDPAENLMKITCPVLAINGEKDIQVSADRNLSQIDSLIKAGGNKDVTIKKYTGMNHLFQRCETGQVKEYAWIEETIAPEVLKDMGDWILKNTHTRDF